MKEIIFVIDYLTTKTGGPRFLFEVMKRLARKGYEVHIITGSVDETIQRAESKIDVINLNTYQQVLPPSAQPKNTVTFLKKTIEIIKKLTNNPYNVVLHFNSHFPNLLPYIVRARLSTDVPIICSIHHLEETHQFTGLIPKIVKTIVQDVFEVNSPCDIIHVPSNSTKQKIKSLSIMNKDNIIVIPPGIETIRYLSVLRRPKENLFVMIGRLEKRKHYEHAIMALKIATRYEPSVKLFIIGDGPLRAHLTYMVRKLSLEENVFLLGTVDERAKLDLLSRAQALIHLGYPEGFGIVILEALASGTPVITYDVPPLNELVKQGVTGVLVNKDDVVGLAKAILRFNKYSFNENTLREVAKRYDVSIVAQMFASLYTSLAS